MGGFKLRLDIVSPVFNEEESVSLFIQELSAQLESAKQKHKGLEPRIILVDDGSNDGTLKAILQEISSIEISIIKLSRNFGHQNAVWAGLESVRESSYCIVMDSDLQDPPKLILEIIEAFLQGNEVVLMQRISRQDSKIKKVFAGAFYELQHRLSSKNVARNVGDFFGLSPIALSALLEHTEKVKYIRGLVGDLGFRRAIVPYERMARSRGVTHYTIPKMFSLAIAGITGFSIKPLLWVVYLALFGGLVGMFLATYVIYLKTFSNGNLAPGWAFATVSATILSTITLFSLAIIAIYLARIIQELKNRPIYLVDRSNHTNSELRG
jgi:glycosyltransferase involved in cell wall biosynthesis